MAQGIFSRLALGGVLLIVSFLSVEASAVPRPDLWKKWLAHTPDSREVIDHAPLSQFLKRYLIERDGLHLIDYVSVSQSDQKSLAAYVEGLASIPISEYNRNEQFAYWINLYNALTLKVVLDEYPVDSILEIRISPGFFTKGPWGKKLLTIEGEAVSLDDIEHRILRPIWRDHRIHYAVNCASIGCPNIARTPYTAQNTDALLAQGEKAYINHPRGVTIEDDKITLSKIYGWYRADFAPNEEALLQYLAKHLSPAQAEKLNQWNGRIKYQYNWSLNEP